MTAHSAFPRDFEIVHSLELGRGCFLLKHPFDLTLLDVGDVGDRFATRAEAEHAADHLMQAIAGSDD